MSTVRRYSIRGGALAEMAILLPLLMLLLLGSAQVGALMYGNITVATAAREGAFVAAQQPNRSLAFSNGSANGTPYPTCPNAGSTNPVCLAIWNSSGLLQGQQNFSVVISPIAAGAPPWSCPVTSPLSVQDGYVTVAVSYNVPIFTPLIGRVLATPGQSYRTVTSSVTDRVFRCTMTNGR